MEIEGLPEGGTQLTSLRDLLVSLQKQDPPIDVCFEVLGSPDKPSECVCLCVCVTCDKCLCVPMSPEPSLCGANGENGGQGHPRACTPASEHQAGLAGCQQAGGPGLCIQS